MWGGAVRLQKHPEMWSAESGPDLPWLASQSPVSKETSSGPCDVPTPACSHSPPRPRWSPHHGTGLPQESLLSPPTSSGSFIVCSGCSLCCALPALHSTSIY